jgi:hypothetical protein
MKDQTVHAVPIQQHTHTAPTIVIVDAVSTSILGNSPLSQESGYYLFLKQKSG